MRKNIILLSLALFFLGAPVHAQGEFRDLETKNGVTFMYKWKNEKKMQKDVPLELIIKVKNTNEYRVMVTFTVDYYYKTLRKASSELQSFCVKSKKAIIGKNKKPAFDGAELSNEQLLSDDFILELSAIEVSKAADCKPKK